MSFSNAGEGRPDTTRPDGSALPFLTQYEEQRAWVVVVHGAFDANSVPLLVSALQDAAVTHETVVVDAAQMTFGDSSVLNALLNFHQGHRLRVARPAPQFQRVLEMTGADMALDVWPTVQDAVGL
ncbi:STAS domain-containing protein [Streptomyces sp. NPDC001228]|uniref:STAS domain-containing protein n=1 Tax=Streptomyces sp. NPDC001228 TaxID=3154381 RepID=UPI0033311A82